MSVVKEAPVTVLDGSTFCVCDSRGDLDGVASASGFFADDTRFLSRSVLTVDGGRAEPVSFEQHAPHLATFELRAGSDLALRRELFVGSGLEETITLENRGDEPAGVEVALELASDFADIFAVKRVEELGAPGNSEVAPARPLRWDGAATVEFADDVSPARTLVHLEPAPDEHVEGRACFRLRLEPGGTWRLLVRVQAILNGTQALDRAALAQRLRDDRRERDESLAAWWRSVPTLRSRDVALERTWIRSVADLAALRLRWEGSGMVPAAGLPWFMTLFGRDTIVTSLQTLVLGPEPAAATLLALAATQADADDPERDAEPGKIVHELRRGKTALAWTDRYYGTADATPLFLVLLSELWRWSGDDAIVRELEGNARRALAWIDGPGDRDGDGFVEYRRRATHGIDNQNWKDSHDSMVFRDGSQARAPIAPAEVQGYVFDAKRRVAELARVVWGDEDTAARLEREAAELQARFDAAFWLPELGWYALGLDGGKRPVDALGSNVGHLLWSGIVPPARIPEVVGRLAAGPLWSGWGVRTLAADERAYDPLSYHDGSVWPHDNSLIAAGLARAGHAEAAARLVRAMLDAAAGFEHRLPELFAGFERTDDPRPVEYPAAARPQAWAAGTPVLLLEVLLGLRPDPATRTVRAAAGALPAWAEGLVLDGFHAFGRRWRASVRGGAVTVAPFEPK